ncbi:MAG: branched-chain amino acid ABC transporter permease [Burkholderiales bacterium]|jgi:branched-chain amino acid transport system permease protein
MSVVYLQALISGLLIGGVFSLISVGLTLTFGVMKIKNFAHGDFLIVGMYFVFFCHVLLGLDPYVGAILGAPLFFLVGWIIQSKLIRPILHAPETIKILITVGISLVLQNLATFLFSPDFQTVKVSYGTDTIEFFGARISNTRLVATLLAVLVVVALYQFLMKSSVGRAIRACAEDGDGARAVGINVDKVYKIALGISTLCVCVAGAMMTPFFYISPTVGISFTLTAFVVVVLGGLGNLKGALVGGFIIGLVESFGEILMPEAAMKQIATFTIFTLILLFRPSGLFGQKLA